MNVELFSSVGKGFIMDAINYGYVYTYMCWLSYFWYLKTLVITFLHQVAIKTFFSLYFVSCNAEERRKLFVGQGESMHTAITLVNA